MKITDEMTERAAREFNGFGWDGFDAYCIEHGLTDDEIATHKAASIFTRTSLAKARAALEAALAAVDQEPVWQTMDTAPKDGTHVLIAVHEPPFVYTVEGVCRGDQWDSVYRGNVNPLCWAPKPIIPYQLLPWKQATPPLQGEAND